MYLCQKHDGNIYIDSFSELIALSEGVFLGQAGVKQQQLLLQVFRGKKKKREKIGTGKVWGSIYVLKRRRKKIAK